MMKGKRMVTCALASAFALLCACGTVDPVEPEPEFKLPDGYTLAETTDPTDTLTDGIGIEFDPVFFSQNLPRNNGVKESDWENYYCRRVRMMGIDKFRVMVMPSWLEPMNDNGDPNVIDWDRMKVDSLEMQSLYKVLDLAEEVKADVTLVLWGNPRGYSAAANNYSDSPYFMSQDIPSSAPNWVVGVSEEMREEWCENFSALVQLLVNRKGYTCIKEITPGNEPDWSWQTKGILGDLPNYVAMCKALEARFEKDGIRDLVKFNLVDTTYDRNAEWLPGGVRQLGTTADVVNTHTYNFGYQTPNSTVVNWEKNNAEVAFETYRHHYIGEFGSDQTVGSTIQLDINEYERGVYISRMMLDFFNGGATGMSYWTLGDWYLGKKQGFSQLMKTGLWSTAKQEYEGQTETVNFRGKPVTIDYSYIKEDYQVRPAYYAYSMLTRFVPRGAQVYPIETGNEFLAATKFVGADGKIVYAFANASETLKKYAAKVPNKTAFDLYAYEQGKLPANDSMIPGTALTNQNLCVAFDVPANSVVLVVQK